MAIRKNQVRITRPVQEARDFILTIDLDNVLEQIKEQISDYLDMGMNDVEQMAEFTVFDIVTEEEVS